VLPQINLQLKWVHCYSSFDQGLTLTNVREWLSELDLTFFVESLGGLELMFNFDVFLLTNE
jgi:hypothetical protein